jgi:hypothetical protein
MGALAVIATRAPTEDADDDFLPEQPSKDEIALNLEVGTVRDLLSGTAERHTVDEIAWALDLAFGSFAKISKVYWQALTLDDDQRREFLEAIIVARAEVELGFVGYVRDDLVDGLQALAALAVHYSKPHELRRFCPSDRLSDLYDYVGTARNAANTVARRGQMADRARKRTLPTLAYMGGSGGAAA